MAELSSAAQARRLAQGSGAARARRGPAERPARHGVRDGACSAATRSCSFSSCSRCMLLLPPPPAPPAPPVPASSTRDHCPCCERRRYHHKMALIISAQVPNMDCLHNHAANMDCTTTKMALISGERGAEGPRACSTWTPPSAQVPNMDCLHNDGPDRLAPVPGGDWPRPCARAECSVACTCTPLSPRRKYGLSPPHNGPDHLGFRSQMWTASTTKWP